MVTKNKILLAHLALFGANLIYAFNYGYAKDVMEGGYVPPFTFILFRAEQKLEYVKNLEQRPYLPHQTMLILYVVGIVLESYQLGGFQYRWLGNFILNSDSARY